METDNNVSAFAQAGAIVAAIVGFTSSPLARFASPTGLALFGGIFALGLASMWLDKRLANQDKRWVSYLFAGIGLLGLIFLLGLASNASAVTDVRCEALEREMVARTEARADLAAVFTALGCRPQTNFYVQIKPPPGRAQALKARLDPGPQSSPVSAAPTSAAPRLHP